MSSKPKNNNQGSQNKDTSEGRLQLKDLPKLLKGDVVAFVFNDERPLLGLLGLWDWRLCGQVSHLIEQQHFSGKSGEQLLGLMREPAEQCTRLFLFGLGSTKDFHEDYLKNLSSQVETVLKKAHAKNILLLLPESRKLKELSQKFKTAFATLPDATFYQ